MGIFTGFVITVAVCSVVRALLSLVGPTGQIKKITDVATNIIIMSVLVTEIISLIAGIFN